MQHTLSTLIKSPISDDLKLEIQEKQRSKPTGTLGFDDWLFCAVKKSGSRDGSPGGCQKGNGQEPPRGAENVFFCGFGENVGGIGGHDSNCGRKKDLKIFFFDFWGWKFQR